MDGAEVAAAFQLNGCGSIYNWGYDSCVEAGGRLTTVALWMVLCLAFEGLVVLFGHHSFVWACHLGTSTLGDCA